MPRAVYFDYVGSWQTWQSEAGHQRTRIGQYAQSFDTRIVTEKKNVNQHRRFCKRRLLLNESMLHVMQMQNGVWYRDNRHAHWPDNLREMFGVVFPDIFVASSHFNFTLQYDWMSNNYIESASDVCQSVNLSVPDTSNCELLLLLRGLLINRILQKCSAVRRIWQGVKHTKHQMMTMMSCDNRCHEK